VFINRAEHHGFLLTTTKIRVVPDVLFHGVGKPDFNVRRLIPDKFCIIIDRALSIGPIDYVSSVEKNQVLLGKS
jgi:hypothetical protein